MWRACTSAWCIAHCRGLTFDIDIVMSVLVLWVLCVVVTRHACMFSLACLSAAFDCFEKLDFAEVAFVFTLGVYWVTFSGHSRVFVFMSHKYMLEVGLNY